MKKSVLFFVVIAIAFVFVSCDKEVTTDNLNLLTSHIWTADSLLADGIEEGGEGGMLEMFNGDTKFNEDGTGYVGEIVGIWQFSDNETAIAISSDSLPFPITTHIVELTAQSLKLTTSFPIQESPPVFADVRMTFKPK